MGFPAFSRPTTQFCILNSPVSGEHLENRGILPRYLIPSPLILQWAPPSVISITTDGKSETGNDDVQEPVSGLLLEDNSVNLGILYGRSRNDEQLRGIIEFCGIHMIGLCIFWGVYYDLVLSCLAQITTIREAMGSFVSRRLETNTCEGHRTT